jgi:hypothetical protein
MTVAKYALIVYEPHVAGGGMGDLVLRFATLEGCMQTAEASDHQSVAEIVDTSTMLVAKRGEWSYDPPAIVGQPITWRYMWTDEPGE